MESFGTLLTLVGMSCCCISVFLIAMVGFSLAFRPKRPRGGEVKGMAPAPTRGVATQASLTRMEDVEVAPSPSRSSSGRPAGEGVARSPAAAAPATKPTFASAAAPATKPTPIVPAAAAAAAPTAAAPSAPAPPPDPDRTVRATSLPNGFPPPRPAAPPLDADRTVRATSLPNGYPPPSPAAPPRPPAGGPPPVPPEGAAAPPTPPTPSGPPPIPPGTRLLVSSPTIAPGSGDDSYPPQPPPRKV